MKEVQGLRFGPAVLDDNNLGNNNRFNANFGNVNRNDNSRFGNGSLSFWAYADLMETYCNIYQAICSYDNLHLAYKKARKRKTQRQYVIEFEKDLGNNLCKLQWELLTQTYSPHPLTSFTVRDPKTRKISAAHFRDRLVHHAICNTIQPIFESRFIHDTFANRKGKGTLAALNRFEFFLCKVAGSGKPICRERESFHEEGFCLKCDIKHYFEAIDHKILLSILRRRIKDEDAIWLIKVILENHKTNVPGKGMPLGNLTSQFLANVYLAELDNFVKHELRAKYYLRYVDDFLIVSKNRAELELFLKEVAYFLHHRLALTLHESKTRILPLSCGVPLLGFRVFPHFKLLKKSNQSRIWKRLRKFREQLVNNRITREKIAASYGGWNGYAKIGDTFRLRRKVRAEMKRILGCKVSS